jgi:DNA-binding NtrC family response regulator
MPSALPREVLVVEEHFIVRMVAADALAERGIMAWEATDADEALLVLEEHPRIGLVFTEVSLPGKFDGLRLAHELSALRPDVSLVITSGTAELPGEQLPDDAAFLAKPYSPGRLVNLVAEKLDRPISEPVPS